MLIADDDSRLLEYYRGIFEQDHSLDFLTVESSADHFDVHTFPDGVSLVDYFLAEYQRGERIPLCLLDMRMKAMDGLTAAETIRAVDPKVIIIIVTAYSDVAPAEIRRRLQEDIYYIKKPFNEDELYSLVTSLLKNWNIQEALRESESNYRRLMEQSNEGIVTIDFFGNITFVNATISRMLGYDVAEMSGCPLSRFMDANNANILQGKILNRLNGLRERYELDLIRRDGQVASTIVSASPISGKDGTFTGSFAVISDITEIKQAHESLRKSNEELVQAERIARENELWLNTILKSVLMGIVMVDAKTREIIYVNETACNLMDCTQDMIIGSLCHNNICPADIGTCPVLDLGQAVDHSERVLLKDGGETIPIIKSVKRINYQGRDVLLECFVDISDRKRIEEELLEAKETAVASSKAKSQFLANMSHEIRTPMNGVLGMLDLLQDSKLNEAQLKLALMAHNSAEKLLSILNDILDFSKIEAGKFELAESDFSLRNLLAEIMSLFQLKAQDKLIGLCYSVDESVPDLLKGDAVRLRQILINLLGNAIKFTEEGKVSLAVSVAEETVTRLIVRFDVLDTGPGISHHALANIFDAFTQADNSMTRRHEGTGLGLPISKQLVEMMGGSLCVESTPGKGSQFWFTIRIARGQCMPQVETVTDATIPESGSNSVTPQLRVLLAEDNLVNQEVGRLMLESLDCLVDVVEHGGLAAEAVFRNSYDIIFMDCQMPKVDGYEATKMIRKEEQQTSEKKRRIPIVALTAHAMEGDRISCIEAGMDDYLAKPFNATQIRDILQKWAPGQKRS
jgi:PAS domain S-box-containing protein